MWRQAQTIAAAVNFIHSRLNGSVPFRVIGGITSLTRAQLGRNVVRHTKQKNTFMLYKLSHSFQFVVGWVCHFNHPFVGFAGHISIVWNSQSLYLRHHARALDPSIRADLRIAEIGPFLMRVSLASYLDNLGCICDWVCVDLDALDVIIDAFGTGWLDQVGIA
jgi:hypothetical protein